MEASDTSLSCKLYNRVWPGRWGDRQLLTLLVVLAIVVRGFVLFNTVVPARDSIGFIRYALSLEQNPWTEVLRKYDQHPGYPLAIIVVSWPVRYFAGEINSHAMQFSAQLVSSIAGVFIVFPLFHLGKYLFGRSVGFWSAVLLQCLPVSGHLLSDGISDSLYLFFATCGLYFGAKAVEGLSLRDFLFSGFLAGLSYLVRPEGALLIVAVVVALLGMQWVPPWRISRRRFCQACLATVLPALLVTSPCFLAFGHVTNKPTIINILTPSESLETNPDDKQTSISRTRLHAAVWAVTLPNQESSFRRAVNALTAVLWEFSHALQHYGWALALLAVWCGRNQYREKRGIWVGATVMLLLTVALSWLAFRKAYVSDRHVLLLVVCSISHVTAGALQVPHQLMRWLGTGKHLPAGGISSETRFLCLGMTSWALILLLLAIGAGLSKTLRPLHGNRLGHLAAGQWLAENTNPADIILDDHCWAHYYAGRIQEEGIPNQPKGYNQRIFVVVSRPNAKRPPQTPRWFPEQSLRGKGGRVVFQWPRHVATHVARVVIYRMGNSR